MASLFLPGLYPLLATYRSDEDMLEPNLPTGIHPVRLALFLMIQTRNQIALSFSHHWGSYWIGLSPRTLSSVDRPQDKRRQDQKAGPSRKTLCSADRPQDKRRQDQKAGPSRKTLCSADRLLNKRLQDQKAGSSRKTLCSADRLLNKRLQDQKAGSSRKTLCSADRLQNKRLQNQEAGWSPKNFCADDRLQSIGKFMKEFRSRLITYQCRAWTIPSYIGRFDKTSLSIRLRETM